VIVLKRICSMILALALVIACLPAFRLEVHAVTVASGECGDNANWTLDDAGTLTISGTGGLMSFASSRDPWKEYRSSIKKVVIHEGITAINQYAFSNCENLTSVELPKSLLGIGPYSFSSCSNLVSIEIPDSVRTIRENAFLLCTSLTSVEIPDSVVSLYEAAFAYCSSLTDVTIGSSVVTIENRLFEGCTSLTRVEIPDSVTSINTHAFFSCTSLTSVTIPDSVTTIGEFAFKNCNSLVDVTIGNSVTTIGDDAFRGCTSLTSVEIPSSVTKIGGGAFYKCSSLSNVVMPDSVTYMGYSIFEGCTSLTELPLSSSIDSIAIGMFSGCTSLTNVVIPDFVTVVSGRAFYNCTGLTDITISNSVTEIGEFAFCGCNGLDDVTIPDSVNRIGEYAFSGCASLKRITFEGDAPRIGDYTFRYVTATASYPANAVTWTEEARQNYNGTITWVPYGETVSVIASGKCGNNANWILDETGRLTIYGTDQTYGYNSSSDMPWYPYFSSIKSVVISDGITLLGQYSFTDCTSLTSVTCGDTLRSIEAAAFAGCTSLTSVTLGGSLSSLSKLAFQGCTSLTEITIPDRVFSIGDSAFADCANLTSVKLSNSLTNISPFMFGNCTSLTGVTIPEAVTIIHESAFAGCTGLTSVSIPNSVELIHDNAFASCTNLSEIFFAGCAPEFAVKDGEGIFYNVTATAYYPSVMNGWKKDMRQNYGGNITWVPYERADVIISSGTCGADVTWKLDTTGTLTISGTGDMHYYFSKEQVPWYNDRLCVKTVMIEHGVTDICQYAFRECVTMTAVTISDSVTRIGSSAFYVCNELSSVTIPDSVTEILPDAFNGCNSLKSLVIPDSITKLGGSAFRHCSGLISVTIGNSVTSINDGTFYQCNSLNSVTIPGSVTSIGSAAFYYCTDLSKITFKGSAPTFSNNAFEGVTATAYYYPDVTWTEDVLQNYGGTITWVAMGKQTLSLGGEEFAEQDTVWIEGLPYPIQGEGNDRYVELSTVGDCYMVTYTYHVGDAADVHTQYPTGMKVYKVSGDQITYIPELDNLLQYSGASIRITGTKGIRMITSLNKETKAALTGKGLAGFKLLEYGTALCFANEIPQGDALVLGRGFTRSNYAYKKGVADPVFASTNDLIQYTNVLVGFSLDQCKDDIAMRSYITLEDAAGNQITLYGGTIYRSIGYIAYQNRTVFTPKTASYNYVWEIIHHVYGDKYDADYKG